ncbi:hypothetical protein PENSPDRAFT_633465 [Peniophora sp. CONT]|nr:hypothetical protein PENSPDRAFT_633465 [Peniophora sp. CONT]
MARIRPTDASQRLFGTARPARQSAANVPPPPPPPKAQSPHGQVYSDFFPAMIPIALMGSAVYLGLELVRTNLSREKYLDEARARINELEAEIDALRQPRTDAIKTVTASAAAKAVNSAGSWRKWLGW